MSVAESHPSVRPGARDDIPVSHLDLVDCPPVAALTTLMHDGSPQTSPVWVERDNGHIVFNTAKGRVKERNMRRDPRIGLSITSREDPMEKVGQDLRSLMNKQGLTTTTG